MFRFFSQHQYHDNLHSALFSDKVTRGGGYSSMLYAVANFYRTKALMSFKNFSSPFPLSSTAVLNHLRNLQQMQMSDLHHCRKDAYDDDVCTEPALISDVHSLDESISQQFHQVLGGFVFGIEVLLQFHGFIACTNEDAKRSESTFRLTAILPIGRRDLLFHAATILITRVSPVHGGHLSAAFVLTARVALNNNLNSALKGCYFRRKLLSSAFPVPPFLMGSGSFIGKKNGFRCKILGRVPVPVRSGRKGRNGYGTAQVY